MQPLTTVKSFDQSLIVIEALGQSNAPVGQNEIRKLTGLPRGTTQRLLTALVSLGYVILDEGQYSLAPKCRLFALSFFDSCGLAEVEHTHLPELSDRLNVPLSIQVLDGQDIVVTAYHDAAAGRRTFFAKPGTRVPALETAGGIALFAARPDGHLGAHANAAAMGLSVSAIDPMIDAAQKAGFALFEGDMDPGLVGVAVALRNPCGSPFAALHASIYRQQNGSGGAEAELGAALVNLALAISLAKQTSSTSERSQRPPSATDDGEPNEPDTSLSRGLRVVAAFGKYLPAPTIADLARATNLDRAVVRRLLNSLVARGYAEMQEGRYRLTPRTLGLGYARFATASLNELVQPVLDRLSSELAESASVYVLKDGLSECIARSDISRRRLKYMVERGTKLPLAYSASGRVLMSTVPDEEVLDILRSQELEPRTPYAARTAEEILEIVRAARRDGFVVNNQELDVGMLSASVVLKNRRGEVLGSIGISSQVERTTPDLLKRNFVPILLAAAEELAAYL